jgi:hypothetical protein
MTQIKLLVLMPASKDQQTDEDQRGDEDQQADGARPDGDFTDQANAILRFDGGWRLTMSGAEYPSAAEGSTEMAGAADEPPVKEAIEALVRATAKPDPEESAAEDGHAERSSAHADDMGVHTEAEVLEFQVPEGSDTVRVRVEPEVVAEDGEQHIRVKVNDPSWVKDTDVASTDSKGSASKATDSKAAKGKEADSKPTGSSD